MRTLLVDTALLACTVAVAEGERLVAAHSEPMARGHQERLGGIARDVLAQAGGTVGIGRIAVTVGPGSFTGLRVGLAFAKGFGVALGVPVVGLGVLDALAESADGGPVAALIDARRDQVYLGLFRDAARLGPPEALPLDAAAERIRNALGPTCTLIGTGAPLLAERLQQSTIVPLDAPSPQALASLASRVGQAPAAPLYLRPPDATPPKVRP